MPTFNGINAVINGVSTGRSFTVNYTEPQTPVIASSTKGAEMMLAGNGDWTATINYFLTPTTVAPPFFSGEDIAFVGSVDGTTGVGGTGIVDSIDVTVDIEGARPIECTMNISGNSALVRGAAVAADATLPDVISSIGSELYLLTPGEESGGSNVVGLRTVSFTITADNVSYVNSNDGAIVKRLRGNMKTTLNWTCHPDALSDLPANGTTYDAILYLGDQICDDNYYHFQWIVVNGVSGIEVNRETAAVVGATVNCNFTGYTKIDCVLTEGTLAYSDGSGSEVELWPA